MIIASHVIYYFKDKKKAFEKIFSHLKEGGRDFFVVNGKEYGPFENTQDRGFRAYGNILIYYSPVEYCLGENGNHSFIYRGREKEYVYVNGKVIGEYDKIIYAPVYDEKLGSWFVLTSSDMKTCDLLSYNSTSKIPKTVKSNQAEAAIEFIDYDATNFENGDDVDKIIIAIKETRTAGNYFKPGEVCSKIVENLKNSMPSNWKFSPSYHHVKCANYFKIREGYNTDNPEKTKKEYCIYDPVFDKYIYTKQWIDFLTKKLKNKNIYSSIFKK